MHLATLITFVVYLIGLIILGIIAYRKTHDLADYILGGRQLGSGVAALGVGASDMSGWLLLGLPGALYASGLNQIWIALGLIIGAYLNWLLVAKRLRIDTEQANNALTIPEFLQARFQARSLRIVSALVILIFFTFYVASGLVSSATLFENSFGLNYTIALWISVLIIMGYTFIGGFLAISWADVFQGLLMLLALLIVPMVAIVELGGWQSTTQIITYLQPTSLEPLHDMTLLEIISLMAWGLGYFGQPHILARFMAIKSVQAIPNARRIAMTWMITSLGGAILTGLVGIAYFANNPLEDPEEVFLVLSQVLFNPWIAGILLAAVLSAIMSTVDAQLVVASSAVTDDFYRAFLSPHASQPQLVWIGRLAVIGVTMVALIIAQNPDSTILDLVGYAWAGFGSSFGPVIIFSLFWPSMTRNGALAGLFSGAIMVVLWRYLTDQGIIPFSLYEMVPAFILSSIAIVVVSWLDSNLFSTLKGDRRGFLRKSGY
jgi:sodium/proline symporter